MRIQRTSYLSTFHIAICYDQYLNRTFFPENQVLYTVAHELHELWDIFIVLTFELFSKMGHFNTYEGICMERTFLCIGACMTA